MKEVKEAELIDISLVHDPLPNLTIEVLDE